jgi:tRNA pseudouridine13 synthase
MQTSHWAYLHPRPAATGRLKQHLSDFKVTEILGYEPSGQGEHIYLWVRKEGLNTAYLAEQIAKFARVPASSVTYAGRKDKYAVTEQWLSVHKPGKAEFDWQNLDLAGAEVLKAMRHDKKLRTGVLKGNVFDITVRELSGIDELEGRIQCVAQQGVPNYYGSQRFGDSRYDPRGGNLVLAEKMLDGEVIRNRNKRSMAISAMRSWLFNEYLSQRIADGLYTQAMPGDVMILQGSASFFCAEQLDEQINQRLQTGDIQLSAPLWGKGDLASSGQALVFEHKLAKQHHKVSKCLAELGLKQERRAIKLQPQQMHWNVSDSTLNLQFILPAGAFATSVLREIVDIQPNYEVE